MRKKIKLSGGGTLVEDFDSIFNTEGVGAMFGDRTHCVVGRTSAGYEVMIMTREVVGVTRDKVKDDTCIDEFDDIHCYGMVFIGGRLKQTFFTDGWLASNFDLKTEIYEEGEEDGRKSVKIVWDPYDGEYADGVDPEVCKVMLADIAI